MRQGKEGAEVVVVLMLMMVGLRREEAGAVGEAEVVWLTTKTAWEPGAEVVGVEAVGVVVKTTTPKIAWEGEAEVGEAVEEEEAEAEDRFGM